MTASEVGLLGEDEGMRWLVLHDERIVALPFEPAEVFRLSLCWPRDLALSNSNRTFVDFAVRRYREEAAGADRRND